MRSFHYVLKFVLLGFAIWLADAALLSLFSGMGFGVALWFGASHARRLVRLFILIGALMVGVTGVFRREIECLRVFRMRPSRRASLYGDVRSKDKSCRVLYHSLRMATLMHMSRYDQDNLRILCHCYDMGIVSAPSLERKGGLHVVTQRDDNINMGVNIVKNIPQLSKAAHLIACQQEFYNGKGRRALSGKSIPLACRIFTLALMYDDLTHSGKKLSHAEAMNELEMFSGTVLDPDVVSAFRKLHADKGLAADVAVRLYAR